MSLFKIFLISLIWSLISTIFFTVDIFAENNPDSWYTVPHSISYQWLVNNASGEKIDYPLSFRFSLWVDWDFKNNVVLENGELNIASDGFSWYEEVQILKPDSSWFFHTDIGKNIPLPQLDFNLHKFLQIEVKPVDLDDTFYEVLDIDFDINNSVDRRLINSSAYSINSDNVDNHWVWTSSWDIVVLNGNWKFDSKFIPEIKQDAKNILFESDNFLAKNVFNALVWLKNLIEEQIVLFLEEKDARIVSDKQIILAIDNWLDELDKKIITAKTVQVNNDDIISNNVEDALVGLKKLFEENISKQNESIKKLEHEILLLKAEKLLKLPVEKLVSVEKIFWEWEIVDWSYVWKQSKTIALALLKNKKHKNNTSIETIIDVNEIENWKNGFIVFDYRNENEFKYVWIRVGANYWTVWQYINGEFNDVAVNKEDIPDDLVYHIFVNINEKTVNLTVNWEEKIKHVFENKFTKDLWILLQNAVTKFWNFAILTK